ncbi:3-deoxy-manno-octulosonate cytidylyltransferase [Lutibacter sp.]
MKIVAMIPARYEASRFPGKLMKNLAGKTVILRTYEATKKTNLFDEVYVVTDSDIIFNEITSNGGKAIKSKKEHKSGSDRIAEAVENIEATIVVNVQGDEPFTQTKPLFELLKVFKLDKNKEIDIASLMLKIEEQEEINNPNNVKVVVDEHNFALYFSRSPIPFPREKLEATYFKHIGIYAFRKESLLKFTKLPMNKLEKTEKLENLRFLANGLKVKMVETNYTAIGIDTPEDLEKANMIFKLNENKQ